MKKIALTVLLAAATIFAVNCGGGGGGGSNVSNTTYFTHAELAAEFVTRLNLDLGYDVELVKINTRQYDYIVVYDYDTDSYDAYWIGNYDIGESMAGYLNSYDYKFYYDLDFYGYSGNEELYEDFWSGLIFEEGNARTRSVSAMQSHLANVFKSAKVTAVMDKYGLEAGRANDLVTLSMNFKALSLKGALTASEYDQFAMSAVGTSATELLELNKSNDIVGGLKALKRAADLNGVGVEHMGKILEEEFGMSLN